MNALDFLDNPNQVKQKAMDFLDDLMPAHGIVLPNNIADSREQISTITGKQIDPWTQTAEYLDRTKQGLESLYKNIKGNIAPWTVDYSSNEILPELGESKEEYAKYLGDMEKSVMKDDIPWTIAQIDQLPGLGKFLRSHPEIVERLKEERLFNEWIKSDPERVKKFNKWKNERIANKKPAASAETRPEAMEQPKTEIKASAEDAQGRQIPKTEQVPIQEKPAKPEIPQKAEIEKALNDAAPGYDFEFKAYGEKGQATEGYMFHPTKGKDLTPFSSMSVKDLNQETIRKAVEEAKYFKIQSENMANELVNEVTKDEHANKIISDLIRNTYENVIKAKEHGTGTFIKIKEISDRLGMTTEDIKPTIKEMVRNKKIRVSLAEPKEIASGESIRIGNEDYSRIQIK